MMQAVCEFGQISISAELAGGRMVIELNRGGERLSTDFEWRHDIVSGIRRWARACTAELDGWTWSPWGRRAGRWTLLAQQGPAGAYWTAAYRVGLRTIAVASGSVYEQHSARKTHDGVTTSAALLAARLEVEASVISWVRQVRRALIAKLTEPQDVGATCEAPSNEPACEPDRESKREPGPACGSSQLSLSHLFRLRDASSPPVDGGLSDEDRIRAAPMG